MILLFYRFNFLELFFTQNFYPRLGYFLLCIIILYTLFITNKMCKIAPRGFILVFYNRIYLKQLITMITSVIQQKVRYGSIVGRIIPYIYIQHLFYSNPNLQ